MSSDGHSSYDIKDTPKSDFLSNILLNWKEKFKSDHKKKDNVQETPINEEDALSKLATLDEKTENLRIKTRNRFMGVALFLSVGMFIITGLVKTYSILTKEQNRPAIETKVQDVKLNINGFTKWQEIKDQEVGKLGIDIKHVETSLTEKIDTIQTSVSKDLNETKISIAENLQAASQENKELLNSTLSDIKKEIKSVNQESKQYADEKSMSIQEKIAQVENKTKELIKKQSETKLDVSKLELPSLVQDNKNIQSAQQYKNPPKKIPTVREIEVEEAIDNIVTLDFSTLPLDDNSTTKDKIPSFTLMPGFSKGMLVTGADVPTLAQGTDVSRVVWISATGDTLIANNHTANVKECLIQGAATGSFASQIAEIRLTEISCSAVNENGEYYKIKSAVKGWVYGEGGKYGLKGRLVSKEGEIIKKAIPLAILEGAIKALENSTQSSTTYVSPYGGTTQTSGVSVSPGTLSSSMAQGTTNTAKKTLDKFSDYYLKILEQLNPVIEILAGREVTIAFAGGETLKLEPYTPTDVNFFENKEGLPQ